MTGLPSFIVIGGTCGSGKTTIAQKLGEILKYEVFDGDDFHTVENKAKMAQGIPLNDEDRIPWLNKLVNLPAERGVSNVVIACSALKRKYRDILVAGKSPKESKIVMLKVSREELERRVQNRPVHYAKISLLDSQLKILELPETNDDVNEEPHLIIVKADSPIEEVLSTIMEELKRK
ncbi:shikimate kinase domain-containing protein [Ditylenchus destructor]|uniref:Gluconokinase n=1 Tax=Ditylenchus destructor TaxID=166010 RepID=A0AAD4R725_9BILA|nr:shikimate kinase domain-containing protein [Ditylenchus destructor]